MGRRAEIAGSPHWVEFYVRGLGIDEMVKVSTLEAPCLYDDGDRTYRSALAQAVRAAKKRGGLHPCTSSKRLAVDPHDWSDSVDVAMESRQ